MKNEIKTSYVLVPVPTGNINSYCQYVLKTHKTKKSPQKFLHAMPLRSVPLTLALGSVVYLLSLVLPSQNVIETKACNFQLLVTE